MKVKLVTFALLASICAKPQTATVQSADAVQKESAVILLRVINTAEMTYHTQKGSYGDFRQLVSAHLIKPDSGQLPSGKQINVTNGNKAIPGLNLSLSPSPDGNGYQTTVLAAGNGWGFYSNQDAVIFEMHPIG